MLTRFDHAVIAVRDLEAAVGAFGRLGFDVLPGGNHPGMGTANAVIRFGLDYIELLSVVDRSAGERAGPVIQTLIDYLERREGFVGYGITSDDVDADADRIRSAGLEVLMMPLSRVHPDGTTLRWMLAVPGRMPWLRPWPFLIQCDQVDDVRLRLEPPREHPNGATRCRRAVVAAAEPQAAESLLAGQIGLRKVGQTFEVDDFTIQVTEGVSEPGLVELHIGVRDLPAAGRDLPAGAVVQASEGELRIDPVASAGAPLVLVSGEGAG